MKTTKTDWGEVAGWYDEVVSNDDSFQKNVILPSLLRIIGDAKGKNILDVACGQGYFAGALEKAGAKVTAFDMGEDLVKIARSKNKNIDFRVLNAESFAADMKGKFDIAICVLAIQNIENVKKVFENLKMVMNKNGKCILILNHPAFRIPKQSSWHNDNDAQYRRVDAYMTESKIKMDMTPGKKTDKTFTYSYHRPMQYYFKIFANSGFVVNRLEEWVSHKESEQGPRKDAEDRARREIPMFMCLELTSS